MVVKRILLRHSLTDLQQCLIHLPQILIQWKQCLKHRIILTGSFVSTTVQKNQNQALD